MEPQIRYVRTSDGVRIAVMQIGAGPPVLLCRPAAPAMEADLELAGSRLSLLAGVTAVTTYDRAGAGASQRNVSDLSLEAQVRELDAVAACIPEERFTLIGLGGSSAITAAYAAAHPGRVERLICVNPAPPAPSEWPIDFLRENWSMARRLLANNAYPQGPIETQRRYSRAVADSVEHQTLVRMSEQSRSIDLEPVYAQLRVPTLVVQRIRNNGDRDRLEPIVGAIPGCDLVLLAGGRGPEAAREEMQACLKHIGIVVAADDVPATTETAVILFADIVASTALTERLGDAAFRAKARELDDTLRSIIRGARGEAIDGKLLGDGVLATFSSAAQGIDAALRASAAGRDAGLELHLGLHAGDVIREANNVFGGAVNIASRISGLSAPGEVLVSDIVRGLARTSGGVAFEDRGEHALKGIEDPVRVFAVRPQ